MAIITTVNAILQARSSKRNSLDRHECKKLTSVRFKTISQHARNVLRLFSSSASLVEHNIDP